MSTPTHVYCDEAGYTGDDLRDPSQPYFAYAGVALEPSEAADIVAEIRQILGTTAPELKGRLVYPHRAAVLAIKHLVNRLKGKATFVVHLKNYALGAKFFEYMIEPAIAAKSTFFYKVGFHRFVATAIYVLLSNGDTDAEHVLEQFTGIMRRRESTPPDLLHTAPTLNGDPQSILADLLRLIQSAEVRTAVEQELANISDERGRILWLLDLSSTSAVMVLRELSARYGQLRVTLDESKPLAASIDMLYDLGQAPLKGVPFIALDDKPFNYELASPLCFARSTAEHGLQLADLVASVAALAMRDRAMPKAKALLELLWPLAGTGCIMPDYERIDFTTPEAQANAMLLAQLVAQAEAGRPLLDLLG